MEFILSFLGGLLFATVIAFFVVRYVKKTAEEAYAKALDDALKQAEAEKNVAVASLEADLRNAQAFLEQTKADSAQHTKELLEAKEQANIAAIEAIEKRHKEAIEAERKRQEQALAGMKEQVENITNQMLKQRQQELQQANSDNMKQIVDPLKETILKMETALKENKSTQETSAATIKENIATLLTTTMKVSDSADRLSNALTAESKTQGNWGELKIEALLNDIGLERGLEYDVQEYLRDANGNIIISDETTRRMQPDVILHLDESRDLIIDSKVSLTAFIDYTNAETEQERTVALAAHLKSIRNHVKELAKKNYAAYVKQPRRSVDFVMMFVPVDAALRLALMSDVSLWREAMRQGVFIVGEQNLYAAMRAVQVTWTAIKQNANNQAIFQTAEELIARVGDLLNRIQKIGKKLEDVQTAYDAVLDKAQKGPSVLSSARKLIKLGAKPSTVHPLPQSEDDEQTAVLPLEG
ncbi:MAG: DNA recombination protein RmuC [Paludibacteraceae bacterium]|nr:DNA recombination protein RmuC [Paludibacteraceae bacterium]